MSERKSNETSPFTPERLEEKNGDNDDFHAKITHLVQQTCHFPRNSPQYQRYLTEIITLIQASQKLYKEQVEGYEDALQQTWLYLCLNLCEAVTAQKPYNPERSQITTWLNAYLRQRVRDVRIERYEEKNSRMYGSDRLDPISIIEASPDIPPLLEQVKEWVETDPTGELRQLHIRGRKDITAQALILRRLPPETKWQDLAEEWGIPIATLNMFYQRQCKPRLRAFGKQAGYL